MEIHIHRSKAQLGGRFGPRGPKDQKISRCRSGLKISSENEIFERATHRGPMFCGEIETSRLKFPIEIKNFDRDQIFLIVGASGEFSIFFCSGEGKGVSETLGGGGEGGGRDFLIENPMRGGGGLPSGWGPGGGGDGRVFAGNCQEATKDHF